MTYAEAARTLRAENRITVSKRLPRTRVEESRSWPEARTIRCVWPPEDPIAYGVVAHEIAHVVLGHDFRDRRRERAAWKRRETEAWDWALRTFDRFGLEGKEEAAEFAGLAPSSAPVGAELSEFAFDLVGPAV